MPLSQIVIAGATGLVGSTLARCLNAPDQYSATLLVRKTVPPAFEHQSIQVVDFKNIALPPATSDKDIIISALGTTIKKAGSQDAFKAVDHLAVLNLATAAFKSGYQRFAVISSLGANEKSGNFYLRTKGEMEKALSQIGFDELTIVRPSLLIGKRDEERFAEGLGQILFAYTRFLFIGPLRKYRAVTAEQVVETLLSAIENKESGIRIIESDQIGRS